MATLNMTADDIIDALNDLGETGQAQLRGPNRTELYTQREENAYWVFAGTVVNADEAQQTIDDYFNQ